MTQREKRERGGKKNNCVCSSRRRRKRTNKKALLPSTVVALSAKQGVNGSNLLFSPAGRDRIHILIAWLFEKLSITSLGDTFCVESKKKKTFSSLFPSVRPPARPCVSYSLERSLLRWLLLSLLPPPPPLIGSERRRDEDRIWREVCKNLFPQRSPPPSPSKLKSNSPISSSS